MNKYSLFEPDLDYIQSKLTQREILEYYVGNINKPIKSPFRQDKYPTITFKEVGSNIIWKDWATGDRGDAYSFVMKLYNCSFYEAIQNIYKSLIEGNTTIITRKLDVFAKVSKNKIKKEFIVNTQSFTTQDFKYWDCFGITLKTLIKYDVYSVNSFYIQNTDNNSYINYYNNSNLIYGYKFIKEGEEYWKIYFPYKSDKRFLYNGTVEIVEGFDQLPLYGDLLIITKSLKDVMLLYELGYSAISLQGEHNPLTQNIFNNITSRFKNIIIFYDNDTAGINGATQLKNDYNFNSIIIPKHIGTKDITDTYRKYGQEFCKDLMNNLINGTNQ